MVKIADFGLTKDLYERDYYTKGKSTKALPIRWMSSEAIQYGSFSTKSDVVRVQ